MTDNQKRMAQRVRDSMDRQIREQGYAAPVDVLMDMQVLRKESYEDWRFGRVPYLEKVCTANLSRLSFIMKQIRVYGMEKGLKPSVTVYKKYGRPMRRDGRIVPLRFSKTGKPFIEQAYATHYADTERMEEVKEEKLRKAEEKKKAKEAKKTAEEGSISSAKAAVQP